MKIFLAGVTNKYGNKAIREEIRLKKDISSNRMLSYHHIMTKDVQKGIVRVWLGKKERERKEITLERQR